MLRFLIAAAAIALSTGHALANGHGGGDAPPPPKPETMTAPAKVVQTKQGPKLVDLNGMTLYYYEHDTTGKISNCNGKCTDSWVPLAATADADGSKMWAYRYRPLYTSPADKAPGDANGDATTLQWRVARPDN